MPSSTPESGVPRGMSLFEIMLSVFILGIALTPLLTLTFSTSKQIVSVGRHQVAAQIARSVLDRLLAKPYRQAFTEAQALMSSGEVAVADDPEWNALVTGETVDLNARNRLFRGMRWQVRIEQPANPEERERMFVLEAIVSWPADTSGAVRHSCRFKTIKFEDRI